MVTKPPQSSGPQGELDASPAGFGSIYQHTSFRAACSELALSLLSTRADIFLLLGGARVGKSTLISHFIQTLPAVERVVVVSCWRDMTRIDLLSALLGKDRGAEFFSQDNPEEGPAEPDWGLSQDDLAELQRTTAVLDSVELASDLVLEFAHKLRFDDTSLTRLRNLILVGGLEFEDRVANPRLLPLKSKIAFKAVLEPMGEDEIETFIASRLEDPESLSGSTFDDNAISRIARASCGVPEEVEWICQESLRIARGLPTRKINLAIVNKAIVRRQTIGPSVDGARREHHVIVADGDGSWPALPDFDVVSLQGEDSGRKPGPAPASIPVLRSGGDTGSRSKSKGLGTRGFLIGLAAEVLIFLAAAYWIWLSGLQDHNWAIVTDLQEPTPQERGVENAAIPDGDSLRAQTPARISEDVSEADSRSVARARQIEPAVENSQDDEPRAVSLDDGLEEPSPLETRPVATDHAALTQVAEVDLEVTPGDRSDELSIDRSAEPPVEESAELSVEELDVLSVEESAKPFPVVADDPLLRPEASTAATEPPPVSGGGDDGIAAAKRAVAPFSGNEEGRKKVADQVADKVGEPIFLTLLSEDEKRQIQEALAVLRFDPGPIDGLIGDQTRQAIEAFKRSVVRDGKEALGPVTIDLLIQMADTVRADLQSRFRPRGKTQARAEESSRSLMSQLSSLAGRAQDNTANRVRPAGESRIEWLERLARNGDILAQTNLAQRYYHGNGVFRDPSAAARWYQRAADQGDPTAQTNLGLLYFKGDGVPLDKRRAANLSLAASLQGHSTAQMNLGLMYQHGSGVEKDLGKAVHWLRKASDGGEPGAEAALRDALSKIESEDE